MESKTAKTTTKKKTNTKQASNKVKDVEFTPVDDNFLDDDKGDKRLIVFIALAILVIVGTLIGLLVGCQKEEKEEPKKPDDKVVVPEKDEEKENEKEDKKYTYEKPLPVVRKVTSTNKKKKTTSSDENTDDEDEVITYNITFYLNDNSEVKEVEKDLETPEYVPDGYSSCNYYSDEELTEEYDLTTKVTEDKNIYMSCELITYSIVYDQETDNVKTYTVEDNDVILTDLTPAIGTFIGWFTDQEQTNQVKVLNKDIVSFADENNIIYLYAGITTGSDDVIGGDNGNLGTVPSEISDGTEDNLDLENTIDTEKTTESEQTEKTTESEQMETVTEVQEPVNNDELDKPEGSAELEQQEVVTDENTTDEGETNNKDDLEVSESNTGIEETKELDNELSQVLEKDKNEVQTNDEEISNTTNEEEKNNVVVETPVTEEKKVALEPKKEEPKKEETTTEENKEETEEEEKEEVQKESIEE